MIHTGSLNLTFAKNYNTQTNFLIISNLKHIYKTVNLLDDMAFKNIIKKLLTFYYLIYN